MIDVAAYKSEYHRLGIRLSLLQARNRAGIASTQDHWRIMETVQAMSNIKRALRKEFPTQPENWIS